MLYKGRGFFSTLFTAVSPMLIKVTVMEYFFIECINALR